MAMGYQGTANHLLSRLQTTLMWLNLTFSPQQEIRNREIQLFIDVPGFIRIDFKHHRRITDAVMPLQEIFTGENIETRILLVNRRQILCLDQHLGVMVNGTSILEVQAGLQAGDGEEGVVLGIIVKQGLDGA